MSRADFNFAKNFSGNQNFDNNFDGFEEVWNSIEDISTVSFELLIPRENILSENSKESSPKIGQNIFELEELMMRQNLLNLAVKENALVRENRKNPYVDLLVKKDNDIFSTNFVNNISQMTEDDVKFFEFLAQNPNTVINNANSIITTDENGEKTRQNLTFSKNLMELIEYSYKTQRPIRIDFGKDLSVILKIDKQGQISAEFLSSEKATEQLIKTNLPLLKQRLDEQGIKYKKIYYKNDDNSDEDEDESE